LPQKEIIIMIDATNPIQNVDFGHIEAEADQHLRRYFLETDSYVRILAGEKTYVVGRKGTGKSAIYRFLSTLVDQHFSTAALTFDSYPWNVHRLVKDQTQSADSAYVNTWKYICLLELAKLVIAESGTEHQAVKPIREFIARNYGSLQPSFKELLVDKALRIRKLALPSLTNEGFNAGAIELDPKAPPEVDLMSNINILNQIMQDKLLEQLNDRRFYSVLLDKLDDGWDGSAESKSSMCGLLRASRELHLRARDKGKRLNVVVFLRSDIYDSLEYNDKNKAYPDIEFLKWETGNLRAVVEKRIAYSTGIDERTAWTSIFEDKPMARRSNAFNYLVRRTLLRPRDIIQFCASCVDTALASKHDRVTAEDIYIAERSYSDYLYREFLDEAKVRLPEIKSLLECLRRIGYERFRFGEFEQFHKAIPRLNASTQGPLDALRELFEMSIVGQERVGGVTGGTAFEYKYTDPTIQPDFRRSMIVHPGLRKSLKLVERRKRSGRTDADSGPDFFPDESDSLTEEGADAGQLPDLPS
jgi:hypothetical protein